MRGASLDGTVVVTMSQDVDLPTAGGRRHNENAVIIIHRIQRNQGNVEQGSLVQNVGAELCILLRAKSGLPTVLLKRTFGAR
jgi:hypothetical protein